MLMPPCKMVGKTNKKIGCRKLELTSPKSHMITKAQTKSALFADEMHLGHIPQKD